MSVPTGRSPRRTQVITGDTSALADRIGALESEAIRRKAGGYGKPEHGQPVGNSNAVYAEVPLTGDGVYDVIHNLGSKPVLCELKHVVSRVSGTTPHAKASPVRYDEWTETLCRMEILTTAGSLANCVALFMVKGS